MRHTGALLALLFVAGSIVCTVPPCGAGEVRWESEKEARLKELNAELLQTQRERFNAVFFSKDKAAKERIDKQFKEIQKERNELMREVGQRP